MGTDIGAGDEWLIPRVLNDCFKVHMSEPGDRATAIDPAQLLFLGTLAGARALDQERVFGNLDAGKDADFVIVDPAAQPGFEEASRVRGRRRDRGRSWVHPAHGHARRRGLAGVGGAGAARRRLLIVAPALALLRERANPVRWPPSSRRSDPRSGAPETAARRASSMRRPSPERTPASQDGTERRAAEFQQDLRGAVLTVDVDITGSGSP